MIHTQHTNPFQNEKKREKEILSPEEEYGTMGLMEAHLEHTQHLLGFHKIDCRPNTFANKSRWPHN